MADLLQDFIDSPLRNSWLEFATMKVYVRKSWHSFEDIYDPLPNPNCLDIGSIEVDVNLRHTGIFKAFLKHAEEINPYSLIQVECVMNPHLDEFLLSSGYKCSLGFSYMPKNYFKLSPKALANRTVIEDTFRCETMFDYQSVNKSSDDISLGFNCKICNGVQTIPKELIGIIPIFPICDDCLRELRELIFSKKNNLL